MEKHFFLPPVRPLTADQARVRTVRLVQAENVLVHEPGGTWLPSDVEMQLLQRYVDGEISFCQALAQLRALRTCPFFSGAGKS